MKIFTRASDGSITIISKHPRNCTTWHWSVSLTNRFCVEWYGRLFVHDQKRTHQWHDYYRLPFGWTLIISRQDWHKRTPS